jgi:hypothetical protein
VSGPLFGGWLLRVWLVVVVCVSRVLSGCCSSVGSVLFWVVRCFAPGVFRVWLLVFCLWCCSCVVLVAPLFWLLVCFSSWLVHVVVFGGRSSVLLSPLFCVGSRRFVTIWFF